MNIHDLVKLDREPAFPIHAELLLDADIWFVRDYEGGRVLFTHSYFPDREVRPEIVDGVQEGDLVWIPLYGGRGAEDVGRRWWTKSVETKLDAYEHNLSILREIAPKVRAIIFGNCGPEMTFDVKRQGWDPGQTEGICRFVRDTAALVESCGGRPAYATFMADVAWDAHFADGKLRDACNEIGAIQLCLQGKGVVNWHSGPDAGFRPNEHPDDVKRTKEYLHSVNDIWTGVEYAGGLRGGNDILLAEAGFDEGIMGPYDDLGFSGRPLPF